MALLLWPERVQNHQNSFTDEKQNDYQQQFERTMPGAKYEFATPFNDGMNVALDRDGLLALIVCLGFPIKHKSMGFLHRMSTPFATHFT